MQRSDACMLRHMPPRMGAHRPARHSLLGWAPLLELQAHPQHQLHSCITTCQLDPWHSAVYWCTGGLEHKVGRPELTCHPRRQRGAPASSSHWTVFSCDARLARLE